MAIDIFFEDYLRLGLVFLLSTFLPLFFLSPLDAFHTTLCRAECGIKRFPKLIAEVLSPSTEAFDLSEKFEDYKKLETLQEYILISQDKQQVECHHRTDTNTWKTVIYQLSDRVFLSSLNLNFAVANLYRGLD